jgi:nucleoside-diphosphate-sugar epimerase
MQIAVIGSTGVLGRHVVPRLVERGHQVRAIARKPAEINRLQRMGVEAMPGDILIPDTLLSATLNCDAAIHLATAIARPGEAQDWSLNDRIRREGTRNFIAACQTNGVRRYVQQSITLIHGDHGQEIIDEGASIQPNPITQSAVDMENFVQASGFEWCILRGGQFYGPTTGREGAWRREAQAGALQIPGNGTGLTSMVRVVDMARAVVMAIEKAPAGSIYLVVDDRPVAWRTLYRYLAAQVNASEPEPGGEVFLPSLGCNNARIKVELKWEPLYATYRAGLAS